MAIIVSHDQYIRSTFICISSAIFFEKCIFDDELFRAVSDVVRTSEKEYRESSHEGPHAIRVLDENDVPLQHHLVVTETVGS